MPELPEVETVRRGLEPIIGQQIISCKVNRRDVVRDLSKNESSIRKGRIDSSKLFVGSTIQTTRRHGKQLALVNKVHHGVQQVIGLHLGMSGQVLVSDQPISKSLTHVHVLWTTNKGISIAFRDPRRFGKVVLHPSLESLESDWAKLGPDAEQIHVADLRAGCSSTSRAIKAALLDQSLIAGVGNIYADEALFVSGLNPMIPANALNQQQTALLARSIRSIMRNAIKARGSTLRDYRDTKNQTGSAQLLHKVYGRNGEPCTQCGSELQSAQIVQRTTCWCPECQPHC
ncbi:MAG: bifunctional DNA-formamidopyrimidine glycosylase/DNA-(apurinic or apyrimidinic site) lyase [Phycisphaerales bacterium]|nr:bifunctional DNA-formamidopyrimidine glycosylase/DNA-(apurinic or apyrimidinic site) lyase [Phycisphaerales bacterium]